MASRTVWAFLQFCCGLPLLATGSDELKEKSKLVVVLLDGFRPDYWNTKGLSSSGLQTIIRNGAHSTYMNPDFPSLSYPNYYTLMTGLHTESHGMTSNYMYDAVTGKAFDIGANSDANLPMWWDSAEPIWITAGRQNKSASFYYWPGCEVAIRGRRPRQCWPYPGSSPDVSQLNAAIENATSQLLNDEADIIGIYVEMADSVGHAYGFNSSEMSDCVREIDTVVDFLLRKISSADLAGNVNVILVSDHGHSLSDRAAHSVNVSEYVTDQDVTMEMNEGTVMSYWPQPNSTNKVYAELKKMPHATAFLKDDVPDHYNYKRGPFVPPILVVMHSPYIAVTNKTPWPISRKSNLPYVGFHGYDPDDNDMRASFAAIGPAFRPGQAIESLHAVDLYQIMCFVLDMKPLPHNGSWSVVQPLLRMTPPSTSSSVPLLPSTMALVLACLLINEVKT